MCNHTLTETEAALGWPIHDLDGDLICPSCYGDEAFCARCGETLSSDSGDDWLCSECARDEADE